MLTVSYAVAAAAILAAVFYLFLRLRMFITTTTMLVASLLLVYGPAFLSFTLTSGAHAYLIRPLTGGGGDFPSTFPTIEARVGDLNQVIVAMNFSIALMYAGIIAGIEIVNKAVPRVNFATDVALANWSRQTIKDDATDHRVLLVTITILSMLMLYFSIRENHIQIISHFFSIKDDNTARILFRAHSGGSQNYWYRVILSAVAPMFVIWGLLAGVLRRSWPLLLAVLLLFLITMVGKIETLSKAPPAFFLLQISLAALLALTNRITWRVAIPAALIIALVLYITTNLIIVFGNELSVIETVYSRVFEVENETLLENFAVFPRLHPFMWGANIRPIAALMGIPYTPSFSIVAYTWYHTYDITSPSLFIADAWADFSYAGVLIFSMIAGAICRSIDLAFLACGKSVVGIAVLAATFWGVLTLISTALNIALFSGGLLLAPILAAMLVAAGRRFARTV